MLTRMFKWQVAIAVLMMGAITGCDAQEKDSPTAHVPAHKRQVFGVNTTAHNHYSEEWLFNDAMLNRTVLQVHADGKWHAEDRMPKVGPGGWPLSLEKDVKVGVLVFRSMHARKGRYRLSWVGQGKLRVEFGAKGRSVPGEQAMEFEVGDTFSRGGVHVVIESTSPSDPIRELKMTPVGFEGQVIAPEFLERMRPVVGGPLGVMRNMDWIGTNNRPFEKLNWSDRTLPHESQNIVAYEHQIAVWNELKTNPWICIPAPATDEYCRALFKMLKEQLHQDAVVRVEYSNEVWNGTFKQYQWCLDQAKRLGLKHAFPEQAYMVHRSKEIWAIWEQVFGDRERLVRIAATQFAYEDRAKATATLAQGVADELAVGAYFGGAVANHWAEQGEWVIDGKPVKRRLKPSVTHAQAMKMLDDSIDLATEHMVNAKRIANQHGLRLVAYEAGQHVAATGANVHIQELTDLCTSVNASEEMGALYKKYLRQMHVSGLELICMFSSTSRPTKWGSWGQWTQMMNDEQTALQHTPKGDAVLKAAQEWRKPKVNVMSTTPTK